MERVNRILKNHTYQDCLQQIYRLEAGRIFCGHDMTHFLDVARLAYIFNLEENLQIENGISSIWRERPIRKPEFPLRLKY